MYTSYAVRGEKNTMNHRHTLLYLAFNFPPFAQPGPRHNLSTVRRLFAANFLPTVITAPETFEHLPTGNEWPKDKYLRSQIPAEVTIIRCPSVIKISLFSLTSYSGHFGSHPCRIYSNAGGDRLYQVSRRELSGGDFELIYSVNGIGVEHRAA